jgi:hypothetical protein
MAIYTQYGRYLKAKQFKELLTETNDTYMVFGIGNPQWDNPSSDQNITVAPYNTSILLDPATYTDNQFYDNKVCQYFQCYDNGGSGGTLSIHISIKDSVPDSDYNEGNYIDICKDVNPVFPSTWHGETDIEIISIPKPEPDGTVVKQSNYHEFYITKDDGNFYLHKVGDSNYNEEVTIPDDNLKRQYFYEMYIRGKSLERNDSIQNTLPGIRVPVGLLGAVRCSINFVKDIGDNYTGDIDQFWYGDRYWQIVRPDEDNPIPSDVSLDDRFPHHLLITATVNPRYLCSEISVDNLLVPRQIAIYTAQKDLARERYYRAYENIFNFGQYSSDDITKINNMADHEDYYGKILNFTIPTLTDTYETTDGEFKLVLHDYIRGQIRDAHSVDRFGYVISF